MVSYYLFVPDLVCVTFIHGKLALLHIVVLLVSDSIAATFLCFPYLFRSSNYTVNLQSGQLSTTDTAR